MASGVLSIVALSVAYIGFFQAHWPHPLFLASCGATGGRPGMQFR
jgi:hypothetical protein